MRHPSCPPRPSASSGVLFVLPQRTQRNAEESLESFPERSYRNRFPSLARKGWGRFRIANPPVCRLLKREEESDATFLETALDAIALHPKWQDCRFASSVLLSTRFEWLEVASLNE